MRPPLGKHKNFGRNKEVVALTGSSQKYNDLVILTFGSKEYGRNNEMVVRQGSTVNPNDFLGLW